VRPAGASRHHARRIRAPSAIANSARMGAHADSNTAMPFGAGSAPTRSVVRSRGSGAPFGAATTRGSLSIDYGSDGCAAISGRDRAPSRGAFSAGECVVGCDAGWQLRVRVGAGCRRRRLGRRAQLDGGSCRTDSATCWSPVVGDRWQQSSVAVLGVRVGALAGGVSCDAGAVAAGAAAPSLAWVVGWVEQPAAWCRAHREACVVVGE